MNDMIGYIANRATIIYGAPNDGMFTGACFSKATADVSGVKCTLDGLVVRTLLSGRSDIDIIGNGYYRYKPSDLTDRNAE